MVERLEEVTALPRDTPMLIVTGFTKCSVPEFVGPFELMLNTERVIQLENDGDRHDNRKCPERVNKVTLLASNSLHSLNVSNQWRFHLTIGTACPWEKDHVIILAENTTIQISCILMTRPKIIRPRRSAQIVGMVLNTMVDVEVDALADAKVTARSG